MALENGVKANQCTDLEKCNTLEWLYALKGKPEFEENKQIFKCGNGNDDQVNCPVVEEIDGNNVIVTGTNGSVSM